MTRFFNAEMLSWHLFNFLPQSGEKKFRLKGKQNSLPFCSEIFYAFYAKKLPSRFCFILLKRISISTRLKGKRTRWVEKAFDGANGLEYGKNENANATIHSTYLPKYLKDPPFVSPKIIIILLTDVWWPLKEYHTQEIRFFLAVFSTFSETSTAKKY